MVNNVYRKEEITNEKEMIIENLLKGSLFRKYIIGGVLVFFLLIKLFFRPVPTLYQSLVIFLIGFSFVIPVINYIRKKHSLTIGRIRLILVLSFTLELIIFSYLLYLFLPVAVYYRIPIGYLCIPIFTFYSVWIYPFLLSRKYSDFFYTFSFLLLLILTFLEQKGIYPHYPDFPPPAEGVRPLSLLAMPLFLCLLTFYLFRNTMVHFWKKFIDLNFELRKLSQELEKRVQERTQELQVKARELEETKQVLEIKVRSRTKELEELVKQREKIIGERTKELRDKVNELEKFYQLTVGRELKMIELKKEISRLRKER